MARFLIARKIAVLLSLFALGLLALLIGITMREPLWILPSPRHGLQAERTTLEPHFGRRMEHVTLHDGKLGEIGFALSLPAAPPAGKMPVLIVLGGLGKGENNIRYIRYGGDNAIMGYDWPMPVQFPEGRDFLLQAPDLHRRVMTVPGQVVSAMHWISRQPWADSGRISLLGFSFGALAAPSVQAMAANDGITIGWTILAYGGAPFGPLFLANSTMKPDWLRKATAPVLDILLYPIEPTVQLPRLEGRFLVLEGSDDEYVPEAERRQLREAVPEPKTVLSFEGNHIGVGPKSLTLLDKIIAVSQKWLIDSGAVNP